MATFRAAVLTSAGARLLAKAQAGQTRIVFTRAATGDGEYAEGEALIPASALKSQRQEFQLNQVKVVNDSTVYVRFIVTNKLESSALKAGYYVKEVGIYATDPDEGEILYSLAVAVENQWDYMPAYNDRHPSVITMEFYTEVCNAAEVTIIAGAGAYALQADLEALEDKIGVLSELKTSAKNNLVAAINELAGFLDTASIEAAFRAVYSLVLLDDAMTPEEIEAAIAAVWNGETSPDESAMSAADVQEAIDRPWAGETSEDPTALSAGDIAGIID